MSATLEVGTRVYNGGDRANWAHFGTITEVRTSSRWETDCEITPDADSERTAPYWIPAYMFKDEYLGHGGTRFVTEEAYEKFRTDRIATMMAEMEARQRKAS